MIFAQGAPLPDGALDAVLGRLEGELTRTLSGPPLAAETVLNGLDILTGQLDRGELDPLIARYAPPGARAELDRLRPQLSREALAARLALELGPGYDRAQPRPFGRAEVHPLGVLLHIAPGNMAGLPAFTAVEGLLTGNISLVKLPHGDRGLTPAIFARLVEAEPKLAPYLYAFDLPSRDSGTLGVLAALADGIVTWGGDGAVSALRRMAPPGCKLIEWGHRLGFAYLSSWQGREGELAGLAGHILRTRGLLCSSCQVIYLDTEDQGAAEQFCQDFLPLLERRAEEEHRTPGQAAQAALYARETYLEHVVDRGGRGERFFGGRGCSLTLRPDRGLELSPLYGNVLVKCLPRRELTAALRPSRGRLQTAGLLCPPEEREELTALLARAGVRRVTTPAHMSHTLPGEGHDGEYPLRRYVRWVDVEETKNF